MLDPVEGPRVCHFLVLDKTSKAEVHLYELGKGKRFWLGSATVFSIKINSILIISPIVNPGASECTY